MKERGADGPRYKNLEKTFYLVSLPGVIGATAVYVASSSESTTPQHYKANVSCASIFDPKFTESPVIGIQGEIATASCPHPDRQSLIIYLPPAKDGTKYSPRHETLPGGTATIGAVSGTKGDFKTRQIGKTVTVASPNGVYLKFATSAENKE